MDANDIVLRFSIIVFLCVVVWAVVMIRVYNKNTRN